MENDTDIGECVQVENNMNNEFVQVDNSVTNNSAQMKNSTDPTSSFKNKSVQV